ncbi:unnamed protein product [Onchocerca flexuosa]|uniref:Uncharacterized protein n=1 Tax=Onchocerca flexuosa TaxID=387005 RepID=A0A183HXG8_9BILA|nr:unnamed protein product [Onchocerca flexuosa]
MYQWRKLWSAQREQPHKLKATKIAIAQEKKRRWKPSETAHSTSSIVTVSVVKHKEEEIEMDEQEDRCDTHASAVSDFKEELSDTKDRMEELDYEEPMQSSVAEVAEEVKAAEEASERRKERIFERVERHAKHSGWYIHISVLVTN